MGFPAAVSVGGLHPEPAEALCSVSTEADCPRAWLGRQFGCSRNWLSWDQAISQPCSLAHRATFGCHGTSPCPIGWPVPGRQNPPFTTACQYHTRFTIQQQALGASAHSRRRKQVGKIIKDPCVALKPLNNAWSLLTIGDRECLSLRTGGKGPAVL